MKDAKDFSGFRSIADMTDEEFEQLLTQALAGSTNGLRLLNKKQHGVFIRVLEEIRELCADDNALVRVDDDDKIFGNAYVTVRADGFWFAEDVDDGISRLIDILKDCSSFSVDPVSDGVVEIGFTVPGVWERVDPHE